MRVLLAKHAWEPQKKLAEGLTLLLELLAVLLVRGQLIDITSIQNHAQEPQKSQPTASRPSWSSWAEF